MRPLAHTLHEALLAACVAAAPVLAAPPAREDESASARALDLLRAAAQAPEVQPNALRRELAALGDEAIPVLFAVLDTQVIVAEGLDGEVFLVPEPVVGAVWAAFSEMGVAALRAHLTTLARAEFSERTRGTAIRLLGGIGEPQDLRLFGALAAPEGGASPGPELRAEFREGLGALLERQPSAVRWLHELYGDVPSSLWVPLLDALARVHSVERLNVLAGLLGRVAGADALVLREIGDMARVGRGTHDEYVRGNVRDYIDAVDDTQRRLAIEVCGALGDESAVPRLIPLLEGESPGVSSSARWALMQITGSDLGKTSGRWKTWHEQELRFWRDESHAWIAGLRSRSAADVAASITELAHHGLYRHEIAAAIVPVLDRSEPSLRRMACAALASLGSPAVRADLEALFDDPDASVAEAARSAAGKLSLKVLRPPS